MHDPKQKPGAAENFRFSLGGSKASGVGSSKYKMNIDIRSSSKLEGGTKKKSTMKEALDKMAEI